MLFVLFHVKRHRPAIQIPWVGETFFFLTTAVRGNKRTFFLCGGSWEVAFVSAVVAVSVGEAARFFFFVCVAVNVVF